MGCPWQMWGGTYYAQFGDDIIVKNLFSRLGIHAPTYLDLGAHHPFDISNTALFYATGSRGINVEPNPLLIEAFKTHRPEDKNICAGVGPRRGVMPFYLHTGNVVSGKNSFLKHLAEEQGEVRAIEVPVLTVADVVSSHAGGVFPDFLSVDVEGLDLAILRSIDYETSHPKIICVEMWTGALGQYDDTAAMKDFLRDRYFFHSQAGANGIFVDRRHIGDLY